MEPIVSALEGLAVFVGGLAVRVALLVAVMMVVAIPVALVLSALRGLGGLRDKALGLVRVDGLVWRASSYYAPGHTWVRRAGASGVRVGLDDLAQRLLTGCHAIELPDVGARMREGQTATVVRCGDKAAEIVSPVEGTVTAVNEAVARDPSLIHRDPYARGWLFAVEPSSVPYTRLLRGEQAKGWLAVESRRLSRFLDHELGIATADGGEMTVPMPSALSETQWLTLSQTFLNSGARHEA